MKANRNCEESSQAPRQTWQIMSRTPYELIIFMWSISSASGLATQRSRLTTPGTRLGDYLNSNVRIPIAITSITDGSSTELLYSRGDDFDDKNRKDEHHDAVDGLRNRFTGWWSTVFVPGGTVDEIEDEQKKVDDYLEFLDKRYHRLHDVEQKRVVLKPAKSFPVLDWLKDYESRDSFSSSVRSERDALYVLGVAELASTRLLQKHHLPVKSSDFSAVIEASASTISEDLSGSKLFVNLSKVAKTVIDSMRARRRALVVLQQKQIKRIIAATIATALKVPTMLRDFVQSIWKHGGGDKTLALSFGILSACVILLRPVAASLVGLIFDSGFAES